MKNLKLQILSDIHLTPHTRNYREIDPQGDVLILAGDILNPMSELNIEWVIEMSKKFEHTIYLPGNHEYYGYTIPMIDALLPDTFRSIENFHYLQNDAVIIEGWKFLGSTLWTDLSVDPLVMFRAKTFSDFYCIKNLNIAVWQDMHNRAVDYLRMCMTTGTSQDTVVITHHTPSWQSEVEKFKGSPSSIFFNNDLDELILDKKPKLWVHGHTHAPLDYNIGDTRIVCSPLGYEGEGLEEEVISNNKLVGKIIAL